jgi:hypothetical protein
LDVVKYLKEAFGLTKEDAQSKDNYALRWSAAKGHLDVVKYLKEAFGLEEKKRKKIDIDDVVGNIVKIFKRE